MKKVLYVEDNKDTANAVKILLINAGLETELAASGKEALQKAKNNFDLYLLDIILPDMSGWDIFEKLKKEKQKNAKFVFLSAIPVSQERVDALKKQGVSDYITKPFKGPNLVKKLKNIIG